MRISLGSVRWKQVTAISAAAAMMFSMSGQSRASEGEGTATSANAGQKFSLHLHHLHTGESLDVVYKVGNTYVPGAIDKLNHFLRDHRTNDVSHYDVKEFDLLHSVMTKLGKPEGVIDIVCGYRTPWSNNFLRTRAAVTASPKTASTRRPRPSTSAFRASRRASCGILRCRCTVAALGTTRFPSSSTWTLARCGNGRLRAPATSFPPPGA